MADNDSGKPEPKRGIPGGVLLLLLAGLLLLLTLQGMGSVKGANIAFSYQLEPLVNLDLIEPEASNKVALNDQLVTFSGRFRSSLPTDATERFRYLQTLSRQNDLKMEKQELTGDLDALKLEATAAAQIFLHLTGIEAPAGGYKVVDAAYNTPDRSAEIVLSPSGEPAPSSLKMLEITASHLVPTDTVGVDTLGKQLEQLLLGLRSPALGIGDEGMKQQLKSLAQQLSSAESQGSAEKLATYREILQQLNQLVITINTPDQGVCLVQLRSVRSYKQDLLRYTSVSEQLVKNSAQLDKAREAVFSVVWYFQNQELSSRALEKQDPELYANWFAIEKKEWDSFPENRGLTFQAPDQPRNKVLDNTFRSVEPAPNYLSYIFSFLPVLLVLFLLYIVFSKQVKGVGAGAMNFGKSPAKLLTREKNRVTFKDVAGCEEAKEELREIVDFLKNPARFTALGAHIPKGVLCIGAPGTGKTLIAKAVAGEADRPFFSISGSDFVEMFVGVGASRIRDMFEQAKKNAPCIIFMDEIDAVGRHRGAGIGGGHDEREQTLNQLLVEMDGFDTNEGVILIAATNRPDVLDRALLRPGRFDRRVVIDLPDIKGRYEILKVHARKIKLDSSVDLMYIAKNTPGSSGADLSNILNEAALLAARRGKSAVTAAEVSDACDKVKYGKERRSLQIDVEEKRTTAYHEAGHAVVALCVEHADPVDKVTIIPRGLSLGATHFLPQKNRLSYWRKELIDRLAVLMGGRIAESLFVNDISSGAKQDISQATALARSMVCEWGMNELLGPVAYETTRQEGQYLGLAGHDERVYSEATAQLIDNEVKILLAAANQRAHEILEAHRAQVEQMTDGLIEFETLDQEDVKKIMAGTWNTDEKKEKLRLALQIRPVNHTPQDPPSGGIPDHISSSGDNTAPEAT